MHTNIPTKSVAIFCTNLELGKEPFPIEYYWEAYQDLLLALKDRGIQAYFTTGNASYVGGGVFSTAYAMDLKTPLHRLKRVHDVRVDLVFDRAENDAFAATDILVINPDFVRQIANNKIEMYTHLGHFQPYSHIVGNQAELNWAFKTIEGDKIVVKEPVGSGGRAVYIGTKAEVRDQISQNHYPLLVQEFLDTSMGVPGKQAGVHDIRISVCGGNIIGYYIRVAKPGALHSNVSQGGHMVFQPAHSVPHEVVKMVRAIDGLFTSAPRYYAADFVYSNKGWKMIELNPYLALLPAYEGDEAVHTLNQLADYLAEACILEAEKRLQPAAVLG